MIPLRSNQALVADKILLDGRLALFHKTERWLAVADLHFGYDLSQRAAGRLVRLWGMATISERLIELVKEYAPRRLIVLGDLVHDKTAASEAAELLGGFAERCEVVVVAGNHDRQGGGQLEKGDSLQSGEVHFFPGDFRGYVSAPLYIKRPPHPARRSCHGARVRFECPAVFLR